MEPRPRVYASLLRKYTSPRRYYHDIVHIENSLVELDKVKELAEDPRKIELAIWFHDAVYDPERRDNEEKNAEYAEDTLRESGLPEEQVRSVANMIKATSHRYNVEDGDTGLMLDIDLFILGKPGNMYGDYTEKIRKEYSHLPMEEYARNRMRFLRGLLERESIYHSRYFRERYEETARGNIRREMEQLEPMVNA
jgi:predicted metal-dependent HD superfamily phosphohydrolase